MAPPQDARRLQVVAQLSRTNLLEILEELDHPHCSSTACPAADALEQVMSRRGAGKLPERRRGQENEVDRVVVADS